MDIHTHILPGLDDGTKDAEEAVCAARQAVKYGIKVMIATPHILPGVCNLKKNVIMESVSHLRQLLKQSQLPLEILPGAEYYLEPELPTKLSKGELLTLNNGGRFLLIELPEEYYPNYTESVLFELQLGGVIPILAHPERNKTLLNNPLKLAGLVQRGVLLQITSGSLVGLFGKKVKAATENMVVSKMVHFMASDLHGPDKRLGAIGKARYKLVDLIGQREAKKIIKENPMLLLRGNG